MSSSDIENRRSTLIEGYRKASPLRQQIVQLLSIAYEPISRAVMLICLNQLGARDKNDKPLTPGTLKTQVDALMASGLLTQEPSQGPQCNRLLVEVATRDAVKAGTFETIADVVQQQIPIRTGWNQETRFFTGERQLIREVRIGIYRSDLPFVNQQFSEYYRYNYQKDKRSTEEILTQIFNNPFDSAWLGTLSTELYETALLSVLNQSLLKLSPADEAFELLIQDCTHSDNTLDWKRGLWVEQLVLRGRLNEAQQALEPLSGRSRDAAAVLWGWIYFLKGENDRAIEQFTIALTTVRKASGKRKYYFQSIAGVFFVLALIKAQQLDIAKTYATLARQAKSWISSTYESIEKFIQLQQGDLTQKEWLLALTPHRQQHSIESLINALILYWTDDAQAEKVLPALLKPLCDQAEASGYDWLALEFAQLLGRFKSNRHATQTELLQQEIGIASIVDLIQSQEAWELSLTALTNLRQPPPSEEKPDNRRLAWFLTLYTNNWTLQPREQSINAKREWGKGRPIALKRLSRNPDEFAYLTAQDRKVLTHLKASTYGYYGQVEYRLGEGAIAALIGHPLVFWEDTTTRIELVKGEPELVVKHGKGDRFTLSISPDLPQKQDVLVIKESPTRLKIIEITAEHRRIAEILGSKNRLEVPATAKTRVLDAINSVSGILTIHSDIGGELANAETVPSDPKPHVHLLPAGNGLKVSVLVRPFGQGGSYYRPGIGGETVIAEIEGKRLQTTRNLKQEKQFSKDVIAACPTLATQEEFDYEWFIDDPELCLELLIELQELGDRIIIAHPEGERFQIKHYAGLNDFHLKIQQQRDWFATSGELKFDDQSILDMQQLLRLLEQTSSRFIPLGDGQFLALTQEFRKRLDELRAVSEKHGKGLRFHSLASVAIEDWIEDVGDLEVDRQWQEHIARLKAVQTLEPTLPSTLQAELRDYQMEGFRWLARLAHWGVGACLADGMGLGKTLQALALILSRAADGATLVIAPTSVCMNWISEADRFAPTLNVIQFGSGDRQTVLDNLKPFDLLVCSYGLLQQEDVAQKLAGVQWQTIVLDEAQSIKNFATKRSQAAMNLQGKFKLITTGTPIENHLGELWNLFRFINPGLLGSLESFNERFAVPIERFDDKQARQRLKKLIQPFLLRRTKTQVLQELPSRTEIVLHVELSEEERVFYEALRRAAIEKLSDLDVPIAQQRLQVLAEIMKLRRACCNPQLVVRDAPISSAKLQLFGEVLTELLDNRHKVLVFSQFVDHLQILRSYLDAQSIPYQYLDGSTPAQERKKRVDAFQAGNGDVFLISLKAGGTGLNLTAADYVIHMDPWWNPAVEDQASDRAHRIGQQRPVTIYRLVAKDTIEDQIVDLHQHKRELADSLLDDADVSGRVSIDDLLKLIQG